MLFLLSLMCAQAVEPSMLVGVTAGTLLPLDELNRDLFGPGYAVGGEVELLPISLVGLNVGGGYASVSGVDGSAALLFGAVGPRMHLGALFDISTDLWVDGRGLVLRTGSVNSGGWDAGLGVELPIGRMLQVGPNARYRFLSDPNKNNAQLVELSLAAHLRLPQRTDHKDRDRDDDGVVNEEDICPDQHMGARPDPNRQGCPAADADEDGVVDANDSCPLLPQGANPDPKLLGCPTRDADGDEVVDAEDLCPDAPAGANPDPERPGCTMGDRDGDGISDDRDECVEIHHGPFPDAQKIGCPAADRDQDFVPDEVDACPDEVGAPHPDSKKNGCPGLVKVAANQLDISEPIFFQTDKAVLVLDKSEPVLQAVAHAIESLGVQRVQINGHTDGQGPEDYNLALSQRRAQAVAKWLTDRGIAAEILTVKGFGESEPKATNDTEAGRALNRRVEFHILDQRFETSSQNTP